MESVVDKITSYYHKEKKSWFIYGSDISLINEIICLLKNRLNTNVYIKSHDKYWKCYSGERIILFDIYNYSIKTLYDYIMDWTTDFEYSSVQYDEKHKIIINPKDQIFIVRSSLPIDKLMYPIKSYIDKLTFDSFKDQFELLNVGS